jgi:type III pantothenate kinase
MDPFIAVDIGNSRLKFGLYEAPTNEPVPTPSRTLDLVPARNLEPLADWLGPHRVSGVDWHIASVNRSHATRLIDWLRGRDESPRIRLLTSGDLPLVVRLPRPDMVGIDRLLGAVAANRLREAGRSAVVVDLGTAITVDFVSTDGAFLGGAILPGIAMSARALYEFTDLLPLVDMAALAEPPPALGTATIEAIQSGLYWGAVGGVRELIARMPQGSIIQTPMPQGSMTHDSAPPQVFLTGGAAPAVAGLLSMDAIYLPHLVLGGIALTAQSTSP